MTEPRPHFIMIDFETDLNYSAHLHKWRFVRYTKKGILISQWFKSKRWALISRVFDTIEWVDPLDE